MAAFWWVSVTPNKELVNMELRDSEVNGVLVPVLRNTKMVPPFTRLYKFQPSAPFKSSSLQPANEPQARLLAKRARKS